MSIKRTDYLISDVREETDNPNVLDTKDGTIVNFLNRAQDRVTSVISVKDESFLSKEDYIDVVSGTVEYALFSDMLMKNRVISVEWSLDANASLPRRTWSQLKKIMPNEQSSVIGYFLRQGNIVINPVPTSSQTDGLRINYIKRPRPLDRRRGTISSLAPLTITGHDTTETLANDLLTIVNTLGVATVTDVLNGGFDSGTGVITTTTTLTGAAIGNFVLLGGNSTTHSELPDIMEPYLIEYAKTMLNLKDSSVDLGSQSEIFKAIDQQVSDLYGQGTMDADYIPITNMDYMGID